MKTNYVEEALVHLKNEISVCPLKLDGSKKPMINWKEFQSRRMSEGEARGYFANCGGIFAITGPISELFLLDFDTKYDRVNEDTFEKFMFNVPPDLKNKLLINRTRSGGKHVWMRTKYIDKSRKITKRELTLSEFNERVHNLMLWGSNETTAMNIVLKYPYEVTLETRGNDSYGVLDHEDYTKISGPILLNSSVYVTNEEVEYLLQLGYSLDCGYRKKKKIFTGSIDIYAEIIKFNEDCGASGMLKLLERSGLYFFKEQDSNGNFLVYRTGSHSSHSGYVYRDTGLLKIFGTNLFDTHSDILSPFDVYKEITNMETREAVAAIVKQRKERENAGL